MMLLCNVQLTETFLPYINKKQGGRIIFIAAASVKQPGIMLSNAQRASVAVYAKTLANELGKDNILVNTLCPSFTATERYYELIHEIASKQKKEPETLTREWMQTIPLQRPADPEEVANLAVFLASEKASYLTGTCIQIDGGSTKGLF